ncbi:MAG: protein kinase [Myxococcales bacterium]|nr:protein kinase [Myxococcales bacterium]
MENSDQPPAPRPRVDDLRMEVVMRRLFAPTRSAARFGRYVVLDKLGEGGMGVVFAAYDDRLDRRVALKVVRVDADASPRARQRVLREAKALARVSHPNVVQVHEVGEVEGEVFIAMEYLRGPTLAAWIAEDRTSSKPRPWRAVMAIFLPLARGLAAAHGRGLVHRDFKPANVLIDEDVERPVLLDFGLARAAAFEARTSGATADDERPTAPLSSVTATGAMVGTLGYMSPEQCRGDHVDARADQFSFCAALYEALYGALPFPTSTVIDYERAIATRALAASRAPRRVPRRIREALSRGLSARAEDRFESMGSLVAALEADPWRRALRLAQGLAALASLAAAIYFVYAWTRPGVVTADVNVERADRGRVRAWLDATPMIREDSEGTARFVGTAPAGPHTVMIEAEGYRPREQVVRVTRNGQHPIAVQLERERGPLDVDVEPRGSSILLDGHSLGANLRGYPAATGAHTLLVRNPGSHDRARTFTNHADVGHHEFVALPPGEIWSLLQTGNMYPMFVMGDVDGDGLPDLMVGAPGFLAASANERGAIHVFSGADGAPLWSVNGADPTAQLGASVVRAGDVDLDGLGDVLVASDGDAGEVFAYADCASAQTSTGKGCAGAGGFVPRLAVDGCVGPGVIVDLTVTEGLGGAFGIVLFGTSVANLSFPDGCALRVDPATSAFPFVLAGVGPGAGAVALPMPLPSVVPTLHVAMQAFVADPSAHRGFSMSNGFHVATP